MAKLNSGLNYSEWDILSYKNKQKYIDSLSPKQNFYKRYFLLLKTHLETGVHYLCITKRSNPFSYKGSGVKWNRLLEKYPNSIILTKILFNTDDVTELTLVASHYSEAFNCVNNKDFANLVPELGYEGNQGNLDFWVKEQEKINPNFRSEQSKKANPKRKRNNLEKYGHISTLVSHGQPAFREKYGVKSPSQVPEILEKQIKTYKETLYKKYGVLHNMHIPEVAYKVKNSRKNTMLTKYGVEYPLQIPEIANKVKEKRENTLLERYGVLNPSQIPEVVSKMASSMSKTKLAKPIKTCQYCNFKTKSIELHEAYCKENVNRKFRPSKVCEYCNKEISNANYIRWHGANCKEKK